MARPSRFVRAAAAVLALTLLPAGVHAGGPGPVAERVAVLDAGSFIVVEAHQAKLGEVLERIATHLKAELVINPEGLLLDRMIDGRKRGTVAEVLGWLVPGVGFVLIFDQPKKGDPRPPKLVQIWLKPDGAGAAAVSDMAAGKPGNPGKGKATSEEAGKGKTTPGATPSTTAGPVPGSSTGPRKESRPSSADLAAGKLDIPSTPKSEILSVAEQLQAQTPEAQLAIEAAARNPRRGPGAPPAFLAPQSDAAQLSLQQQMERSQALAVEQLKQLMDAYKAACGVAGQGGGPKNPC